MKEGRFYKMASFPPLVDSEGNFRMDEDITAEERAALREICGFCKVNYFSKVFWVSWVPSLNDPGTFYIGMALEDSGEEKMSSKISLANNSLE